MYDFAAYSHAIGQQFKTTVKMFTADHVRRFERATGIRSLDRSNLDKFPGNIVPGFYTLSLIDPLIDAFMRPEEGYYLLNYGLDNVRFTAPIRIDDEPTFSFAIEECRDKERGLLVKYSCRFTRSEDEQLLCRATWLGLVTEQSQPA